MSSVKDWTLRGLSALVPALALATPAFALNPPTDPAGLADTQEPGSVIVFPKFATGAVLVDAGTPSAYQAAKTVIELGAVCPVGATCTFNQKVNVLMHWVCQPNNPVRTDVPSQCPENDFLVTLTVDPVGGQKVTFNPSAIANPAAPLVGDINGSIVVPEAPCQAAAGSPSAGRGYLIGYVVDASNRPIKFDGLIGDVVQRNSGNGLQSESALMIQADPALANLSPIPTTGAGRPLPFRGLPGGYQGVTGQFTGDVRFDQFAAPPFGQTHLILLTLDVVSGQLNDPTTVALDFYNFNEAVLSTQTTFTCWGQVMLSNLDSNLTVPLFGSTPGPGGSTTNHLKGLVVSGQAVDGFDLVTPKTLLAVIQSTEGPVTGDNSRSYTTRPSNNSVLVPTFFVP